VKPDPRVTLSQAAFEREFELARKVEAVRLQASAALGRAAKLLEALDARVASAGRAKRPIAALLAKATNISGTSVAAQRVPYPATPPQRTDSLQALVTDLDSLESAVDGADADPSPDDMTSYSMLSRMASSTLAEWSNLERVDVPKLNARLRALGQKPI
jgi:hypothetical protein